ncbi:MAG: disulfide bond formation protein B [Pseudomonadota bacterium]|nr:disulfide bond formation protein B [Pseudomonadota bacterium]
MTARRLYLSIFLICTALVAFALSLQHAQNLEPCPLCILQRYVFIVLGVVALLAFLHNPANTEKRVYGALFVLLSLAGAGTAGWHVWLQHQPPGMAADCGPGLDYMLETFPLTSALPMIFKGSGDRAEVAWKVLGLSIPEWALIWFVILAIAASFALASRRTTQFRSMEAMDGRDHISQA